MEYIKSNLSEPLAKKIIGKKENAEKYLLMFNDIRPIKDIKFKNISKGKNSGNLILDESNEIWKLIVDNWDYEVSKKIIREIFKTTNKYKSGKVANDAMVLLIEEWNNLNLGKIQWPFSQGAFDEFVQRVNRGEELGQYKDEKVKLAAVQYRRIKEINTVRNDFIETLIFEKNENILPTLNHRRGVDYFINGFSYDQKVAKSPTNEFKKHYGDNWREKAIQEPALVAKYLYQYQDEGRFGSDPRLLVVYLDEDVSIEKIREIINKTDLSNPIEINFSFKHKNQGEVSYKVSCFIILLYN
ncbi:MAG: hypothetical protein SFT90_00670 [Rickettsiales bacterium]|nr:hypothetical protein [Rickettsiales bacterium]